MEAVRPKSKGKGKKKTKPKREEKDAAELPPSSGGASVSALASPVTTETELECTPTDETEPSAPPKTDDVIPDDVMHLLSTAATSRHTEVGSGVDGATGEMKDSELRSDDEQLDKESPQNSRNTESRGKEMESQGESVELRDKETASSENEERVSQMEVKQIETATERELPLHSSFEGVSSGPGMEPRPSCVEQGQQGQIGVDRREVSTEQKLEVGVERSNLGLGEVGMEQRQAGMEGGPAEATVKSVANEATDITVTTKTEYSEEEGEQHSDLLATAHQSVDKALTTAVPVVETSTVASSTSTVVVETNTTVATETPELPREVAMVADTVYPSLSTLAYAAEEEDLIPFSEQDLRLLYQNRQLDAREDTEEAFIRDSWQEHHRLYELLSLYMKSLLALSAAKAHLQSLRNEYNTRKPLTWKFETQTITSSAKCGDRVRVSHDHTYKTAVFNPEAAILFNDTLTGTRELLQEELCMKSYSSQLARIHIDHFLSELISSVHVPTPEDTAWVPETPPGSLDSSSPHLRDAISVLFMFERRPQRDRQFTQDCRQWLNMLMSVQLRMATLTDHQFVQHHLLRCPPGVGQWATSYLQVASPLDTVGTLEAQFGQTDILTGTTPDHRYGYDWGVGMGLHQDWGGPLLDHFVCCLATLLLPIKQRDEFLVSLSVPVTTSGEGERQRWTFVEDDLEEEDEENLILLKESDFISFFDQYPFSEMFKHILRIGENGEIPVAETTSYQMLRLIAFSTCLIRLLGAAFSTLRLARYKEFVKQVGRTIRQTVQYVADTWSLYRSHRISRGDTLSHLPPLPLHQEGAEARYSLNRLQIEFDQFVLRATQWILTAHRLGAWQFLADMPYSALSLRAVWNIFYCIYSNQMNQSDWSPGSEGGERGGREVQTPSTINEIVDALKDPTHKAQFADMLLKTFTSEAVFLLTTFANMARSRHGNEQEERQFISTVVLEIFEVTQVTEFSSDVYSRTGASLLDAIAMMHPFVISILIGRISEVIDTVGENCVSVVKELPLNVWTPTSSDLSHTHQWLVGTPIQSPPNKLARVLLGQLNWGRKTDDGSNDLVLDWWTHRAVALMVVEAHSVHLPSHPGGREFISYQSSIGKYKSTLQRLTMSTDEKNFITWCWEVLLMLKLHPNQVIHPSMEVLTPESSTPQDSATPGPAKDPSVYRRRVEPEWARLSPDSDEIVLPDLTSTGERELAELRDAVHYNGTLAAYVALCLSSVGSDTDHFLLGGLPLLQRLIDEGYFLPALRVIANVTPRFFRHKKILIEASGFLQAVVAVANADSAAVSFRDRITFSTPQPLLLRKMAGLLQTQLHRGRCQGNLTESGRGEGHVTTSGRGQWGGASGEVILQFWLHIFLSYPSWYREQSLLYLVNTLCLAAFSEPEWHRILIDALFEAYRTLGPLYARGGLFSPVLSIVSSSGPPSIFTSVSIKEYPWLAFFSLCGEQQFEEKEGIWRQLLIQLKKEPKITIENALKKAFVELKMPQGSFGADSLSIYRWAEFCSSLEPGHPIVPLVWQKFFSLYLQRPVLDSTLPERSSLGLRFFSQSRANSQRRQMKSCLSAVVMKTQSQITRQSRTSDDRDGEGGGGPQVEGEREYLLNTLSFFQTLNLWLEEPRLHDASLYLPGLPQQYNSQRLATIFSPPEFCFWMEFVPVSEVKVQQAVLIDEWLQVESYQKSLASHTPKPPRDDAMTRIRNRLDKGKKPVAPPTLQVGPAPFEHLTEEIMLSRDSLIVILKSDIQFVVQQASSHSTKANVLVTLDTQYMDGLPVLYSNQPRQFMVSIPCKASRMRSSSRCAGPATIVFRYDEMELSPKWEQMLKVNRSEYEQLVASLSLPLSLDFCKAVVRMEHTVRELSRLAEQLPETERSKAVQSGVNLFYEILTSLNLDCRQFPPSCQFLTSCIQILGQEFIQKDSSQTVKILDCLIKQPSKADLLAPLFHPNNSPAHFLDMYSNVETVAREKGPNVAFSVLTKFNVQDWLDGYSSSLVDRSTFLHQIWRGILLCGPRPSLELEILLETYKHHLRHVLDFNFPELLNNFLDLLVDGIDNAQIAPSFFATFEKILTLTRERPTSCRLGLQQCLDIASFFSQHYMTKRVVARETLYSLVSSDYIPGLSHTLFLVCVTLARKWEESVSMGTATHQDAIIGWWKCVVDVFGPWISSIPLSSDGTVVQGPSLEPETGSLGTCVEYFVESILTTHTSLKDPTQHYSVMALLWEYYCSTLTCPSPSSSTLHVYHTHLTQLPWHQYYPDLAAIEAMMKLKVMDCYSQPCFVFLGGVFPKIEWRAIVTGYCDISLHGNPEAPIQLHVMLLQLLVMFAADNAIMDKEDTGIPEVIADAQSFHWNFIDSKTFSDILQWQMAHCDPGEVLRSGSHLSLSLRLLKAAAGFPGDTKSQPTELHPETWEKRRGYFEGVVDYISRASHKTEHQKADYSDVVSFLFQTVLDLSMQVSEPADHGHLLYLLQTILSLFNTSSLSGGVRPKILDVLLHILDEMQNIHFIVLPIISAACHSLVDVQTLVNILERAISTHFNAIATPTLKPEQLSLPTDPGGYGWHGVTSHLSLPPSKMDGICQTSVSECAGLVLHVHLLQCLPLCSSLEEEYRMVVKILTWSSQLKPKASQEAEVFLIWHKALSLLMRQIQFGSSPLRIVPHLSNLASSLVRFGEDKASEGILGVIGLGKKSTYSCEFRLIARTLASFLYCQMPVDSTQKTQLRLLPNAPGHINDPNRSAQRGHTPLINAVVATKLGDTNFHSLELLLSNKNYAHLKAKVVWCLEYVGDPVHCVMDNNKLFVELCTSLYPQYRFLDLLRVLT